MTARKEQAGAGRRPRGGRGKLHVVSYHLSDHGYGHAVRSIGVIRRLLGNPRIGKVHLHAAVGKEFVLDQMLAGLPAKRVRKLVLHPFSYDRVIVQKDSVTADREASEMAAERLAEEWEERIFLDAAWLQRAQPDIVLSDMAALPLAAAGMLGMASFAIGNFTWDWIFESMGGKGSAWQKLAGLYRKAYGKAFGWFRLPFHPEVDFPPFRHVFPIGPLAKPGRSRRFELARATGAAAGKPWVLLAFASLDWEKEARRRAVGENDVEFFAMRPLEAGKGRSRHVHVVGQDAMPFSDLVASCDAVVTKPGYGILGDCLANGKPMVYVERPGFREAPVLEQAIARFMTGVKVSYDRFYAGDFAPELATVLSLPWRPRENLPGDGLETLTDLIWRFLEIPDDWDGNPDWEPPPADWGEGNPP